MGYVAFQLDHVKYTWTCKSAAPLHVAGPIADPEDKTSIDPGTSWQW